MTDPDDGDIEWGTDADADTDTDADASSPEEEQTDGSGRLHDDQEPTDDQETSDQQETADEAESVEVAVFEEFDDDDLPTVTDDRTGTRPNGDSTPQPDPETFDDPRETLREEIIDDVVEFFESAAADATEAEGRRPIITEDGDLPTESFIREEWFDFSYLADYELVEWKWANRPYSYVCILYDAEDRTYRYHVSEPVLGEFEQYVRDDLTRIIRNSLMYEDLDETVDRDAVFADKVGDVIAEHAATIEAGTVQKLYYYFMRDFLDFGRIDPLMRDGAIEDISCDGVRVPVFIYHRRYRDLRTNIVFESGRLNSLAVRLAQRAGKHLSVSNPLVDASLPDGSRVQLTLGADISTRGTNFTIRKFTDVPYTPVDLINWNTFSVDQMAYFWLAIENNRSLIFAGGTGSGKTTSLNAISFFIPPDSKVVSIEDTREITLPHDNWIQSVTRESALASGQGSITTYDLLQASLRQRPEYILVGEIRTEQRVALTFFQAIGTGHTSYTTIHADSVESVLARLQNPPLTVPGQMLQNLDIVSIQRQVVDEKARLRRNIEVCELVPGATGDDVDFERIYRWDAVDDDHEAVGDSTVLDDIAELRGWDDDELDRELRGRREVLAYLVENDVTDYEDVAATIHAFARDQEMVLERVRDDDLEPQRLLASVQ